MLIYFWRQTIYTTVFIIVLWKKAFFSFDIFMVWSRLLPFDWSLFMLKSPALMLMSISFWNDQINLFIIYMFKYRNLLYILTSYSSRIVLVAFYLVLEASIFHENYICVFFILLYSLLALNYSSFLSMFCLPFMNFFLHFLNLVLAS